MEKVISSLDKQYQINTNQQDMILSQSTRATNPQTSQPKINSSAHPISPDLEAKFGSQRQLIQFYIDNYKIMATSGKKDT